MEDKKIIDKRNVKERTPNDDEEVLKNNENEGYDKRPTNDNDSARDENKKHKTQIQLGFLDPAVM